MKHIAWIVILAALGCNQSPAPSTATSDTATSNSSSTSISNGAAAGAYNSLSGCYRWVHNRDTIKLKLAIQDTLVNGQLAYDNYQIDGSAGTLKGTVRNNQIVAFYDFTSEGMQSVREVAFRVEGSRLVQAGTRQMSYRRDTAVYPDHQQIEWDSSRIFQPVDCGSLWQP